ncbi:S-adenosyl-L-methionine-dependent methyltransferase [Gigaspora margarita]|uniref:S-adenosyl-L-methionine-dependent methyltransferase n=1 Tax=Gigaspora margarita TaxID=4874 RepID=A0A8H4AP35_GIGMA|nr:S-adenosyl-L-methionine-dependent methyltransferase [Gigaspora margarita]
MGSCVSKDTYSYIKRLTLREKKSHSDNNHNENFQYIDGRRFHNVMTVKYPLPNDGQECDRLHTQHFLHRYIWQSNFSSPVEQILKNDGERAKVLDVGCGAATWLFEMATSYPNADFTGFDMSPHQPTQIKPFNAEFVVGNVLDGLTFEDDTFDFIYQRMLFAAYPKSKWMFVINELVRVLKPGGYLELTEIDPLVKHVGPASKLFYESACKAFERLGTDPRSCYELQNYAMIQGKLENIRKEEKNICFGKNSGALGKVAIENNIEVLESLKPLMSKSLNLSSEQYDELSQTITKELSDFNSYYPVIRVYARKIRV